MNVKEESLRLHRELEGKIEVISRAPVRTREELSLIYTPGVAEACRVIEQNEAESYRLTRRGHMVAVITDGTAVLGLGDIGPAAGMPVMEGKCALFKEFGGVDAFPLCINSKDTDTIVETIRLLEKSFGGINLEDIAAPRCFEIEKKLKECTEIPIFHDDQHGTAIVVAAALLNAIRVTGKTHGDLQIVINGSGAAGLAIADLLLKMNFGNLILCDLYGILDETDTRINEAQRAMALRTNRNKKRGLLKDAMEGADVFIGVSKPDLVTREMVASMKDGILFAMANPVPEIMPDLALEAGAAVVGTGRSDFPNQINNVLVFPGIFRGALMVQAKEITDEMKADAARAIASLVPEEELRRDYILPSALDKRVAPAIARVVAETAIRQGLARDPEGLNRPF